MSRPIALNTGGDLPFRVRAAAYGAVASAHILIKLPPQRLKATLSWCSRGGRAANTIEVTNALRAVTTVSAVCAGEGCLKRSVAAALLCRTRGTWPSWCTGVRTMPFRAHAWLEVDGQPVGETFTSDYYRKMLKVDPDGPSS